MLTTDEDSSPALDVLTLINRAADHLSLLVSNPQFRYNQNNKVIAAVDGAWAALSAAKKTTGSTDQSGEQLSIIIDKLDSLQTQMDKLINRLAVRDAVKARVPQVLDVKLPQVIEAKKRSSDPLPGTH